MKGIKVNSKKLKSDLKNSDFLYRFRSANALLGDIVDEGGFQELEKQTIYFALPHSLNDPMEGVYDAYWNGDEVLWENLFRNYALSLHWYVYLYLISDSYDHQEIRVNTIITETDLPTDSFRDTYNIFYSRFSSDINTRDLSKKLAGNRISLRRESLIFLLFSCHTHALDKLFGVFNEKKLCNIDLPIPSITNSHPKDIVDEWCRIKTENENSGSKDQIEIISSVCNRINMQLELGILSRKKNGCNAEKSINIFSRFPELYVDSFLKDLQFTPWRVACFSSDFTNSSMWGIYANDHKGAALVFRTEDKDQKRYFQIYGASGSTKDGISSEVHAVSYQNRPPEIDSFLQMGVLPMKKIEQSWMLSKSNEVSVRLQEMTQDMEGWRNEYWSNAIKRATWKHPDWFHENEQRLVITTGFTGDPAPAPLTYNFTQLEGIIFGMKMTTEDKLKIISIIEMKCRAIGRKDFRFFQAYHSPSKGKMDVAELSLLAFDFSG